ncbi:MAG: GntR family transcriptional regulator [Pseudomonadota bacterium]
MGSPGKGAAIARKISPRKPLGREVYEAIKIAILRGRLKPGERLVEEHLAERLGASRTPVRQAIHMLETENLAERRGRGGFVVRELSLSDIEEIMDLRMVLESHAARKAAEKADVESWKVLEKLNEAFRRAIEAGDLEKMAALNTDFHETIYRLCGNRRLHRIIHDLHDHFFRYRVALLGLQEMALVSYRDHRDMIEAMKGRDPDLTESLVRRHILKGKEVILRELAADRRE